ncbi:carotenoid isomerooxygenase-like isoform X2 [Leptidea sinapis]|uniref:carotenoid isomerooxygenase-like isoform X2 n=1 Tax=Leptidea sinapis TaxID=189913 RepID=UPI00212380FB|nr:carotenoid isomerooxygenase-like isoform X2 [Leptidea sinapis]
MTECKKKLYPECDGKIWLRTCEEEIEKPISGRVTGEIPLWLRGTLLRNGPGSEKVGSMHFEHLFDFSALLHRFAIQDGQVTYQCRFLRTNAFKGNKAANRIVFTEFATKAVPDPCQTIFSRVASLFNPGESFSDNAMISVYPFGDEIYAFTEVPVIHRVDQTTLDTTERKNLYNSIAIVNHTSHPHVMPNGDVYNLGMAVPKGRLRHVLVKFPFDKEGDMFAKAEVVGSFASRWWLHPSYMHSFGITENYFVIVEQPMTISLNKMVINQLTNQPMVSSLQWFGDCETHIVLISRNTGEEVKRFRTENLFYLHVINSFEHNGKLTIDICAYKDAKALEGMYVDALKSMQYNADYADWFRGRPKRLEMDLSSPNLTQIEPKLLADIGCETPRINYELHNVGQSGHEDG